MEIKDILTNGIAIIALLVSIFSILQSRRTAKEQLKLQKSASKLAEKQLEILKKEENNKSLPRLNVTIQKQGNSHCFYITNTGNVTVYNLNLEFINSPDNPLFNDAHEKLPYPELRCNTDLKLRAAFDGDSSSDYKVKLTWENQEGIQSEDIFYTSW